MKTEAIKARCKGVTGYTNVGRPSRWGNPFPLRDYPRRASLWLYRQWLEEQWKRSYSFQVEVCALYGKRLGCTCSQQHIDAGLCHAAVLAAFVEKKVKGRE